MNSKSALLLGASGLVGGFCLQALLAEPVYTRIVLLNRRELPLEPHPRLEQKIVNFENLSPADFSGADDIFCALGTTIRKAGSQEAFRRVDLEYPLAAAKLAREAGGRRFVLCSSVGANAKARNFYLRVKGELEEAVSKLGFPAFHVSRPSLLLGLRAEVRPAERLMTTLAPLFNLAMIGGLRRYRAVPASVVGRAMVAAARNGGSGTIIHEYDSLLRLVEG
ncbi:MAG TPA: oxidoreductase [Candidatus Angelobacter sp.]|nr:oxidoreductase [Candidatus Angelobacter sp.]